MKQCFVISPIGKEGSDDRKHADDVFHYIIKPAMDECGVTAFRSDHLEKPGKISDQMFRAIHSSDLCIAVLTGNNPNVFYELAIAQAARRPVIILIQKGHLLPFDIFDFRCVQYDLDIRSYDEKTHIKAIVNYVKEYETAGWKVEDIFGKYCQSSDKDKGAEFFASSGDYGKESEWLDLFHKTRNIFEIMGITLSAWRRTSNFRKLATEKARAGCRLRVLLMDKDNPGLRDLISPLHREVSLEGVAHDIEQSMSFYRSIAEESNNVEVRLLSKGMPHFFLTRTDLFAVLILYLSSRTWGVGPLWKCPTESELYAIARQEFDALWELNAIREQKDA